MSTIKIAFAAFIFTAIILACLPAMLPVLLR